LRKNGGELATTKSIQNPPMLA